MHSSEHDDNTYDEFDIDSSSEEGRAESTFEKWFNRKAKHKCKLHSD